MRICRFSLSKLLFRVIDKPIFFGFSSWQEILLNVLQVKTVHFLELAMKNNDVNIQI